MKLVAYAIRLLAAAAFAVDAYVHANDASFYPFANGGSITQQHLFLVEVGMASLAALLVLVWPHRASWALALLVAASALGGVLLYRYVDVGALGPLPNMYEPTWAVPGKLASAYAEGAALVLALVGLSLCWPHRRQLGRAHT